MSVRISSVGTSLTAYLLREARFYRLPVRVSRRIGMTFSCERAGRGPDGGSPNKTNCYNSCRGGLRRVRKDREVISGIYRSPARKRERREREGDICRFPVPFGRPAGPSQCRDLTAPYSPTGLSRRSARHYRGIYQAILMRF